MRHIVEARDLILEYDKSFRVINKANFSINVNDFVFIALKSFSNKRFSVFTKLNNVR